MAERELAESPRAGFLDVRDVTKSFVGRRGKVATRFQALGGVTFSLAEGKFLSIVGRSGCGKSTLLRLIDGLQEVDSGTISIAGKPVVRPGLDRGVVFQSPNLLPWRTVVRNVEFGLESTGLPRGERRTRALELLERVGLGEFADYYPSQLSGGMQQRVGLARALAIDPALLLMDEPFAAVDAQTRLSLQEELERVWQASKKSVVFITHDIDEAVYLSDVVLVMGNPPATIVDEVPVDFPRPRDAEIRASAEFAAIKGRIFDALRGATSVQETQDQRVTG